MTAAQIGFSAEAVDSGRAKRCLRGVAEGFYLLTMHEKPLFTAHVPAVCRAPQAFCQFCGFSQYDRPGCHKQRPPLGQAACEGALTRLRALLANYG